MATQRSALPNNPYLMPSACVNAFLYGSPKGIQLPGTRLNAASIEQPGIQHYPATADTHSPKVIGSSHDATHNQRLNAHWLSRRAPLDRLAQIVQASHDRFAQRPFGENYLQPLTLRCTAHRANAITLRCGEWGKPEQWPSRAIR